jgi:hypothetical protein
VFLCSTAHQLTNKGRPPHFVIAYDRRQGPIVASAVESRISVSGSRALLERAGQNVREGRCIPCPDRRADEKALDFQKRFLVRALLLCATAGCCVISRVVRGSPHSGESGRLGGQLPVRPRLAGLSFSTAPTKEPASHRSRLQVRCRPNSNSCAKNNFAGAVAVREVVGYPKKHCASNQTISSMERWASFPREEN